MVLIRTRDGATWERIDPSSLPLPLPGEGGFAASGTCAAVLGEQTAFVAMGVGGARVLKTTDRGDSWEVIETPRAAWQRDVGADLDRVPHERKRRRGRR